MSDTLSDYRPGGELTAELLMAIIAELLRIRKMDASPPSMILNMDGTSDDPPMIVIDPPSELLAAVVGSNDIKGGSLASPQSGTVTLLYDDGTPSLQQRTNNTVTAYNAQPIPISANSLCWVTFFQGQYWIAGPTPGAIPLVLTSTLTARSGSTPGSGTANPKTLSGGSLGTDTGTTYTVNNSFGTSVASGKIVWATAWNGGLWMIAADCP